jgi:hypothetical protein
MSSEGELPPRGRVIELCVKMLTATERKYVLARAPSPLRLKICSPDGASSVVSAAPTDTVGSIKRQLGLANPASFCLFRDSNQQPLRDTDALERCAVADGSTLYLLARPDDAFYLQHITLNPPDKVGSVVPPGLNSDGVVDMRERYACQQRGVQHFPAPSGICVNMMPFLIGDMASLPEELRPYEAVLASFPVNAEELGKVGYLTIDERRVEAGASQRRPGVHTESPGVVLVRKAPAAKAASGPGNHRAVPAAEARAAMPANRARMIMWGGGRVEGGFKGGIFMVSNQGDALQVSDGGGGREGCGGGGGGGRCMLSTAPDGNG